MIRTQRSAPGSMAEMPNAALFSKQKISLECDFDWLRLTFFAALKMI
jgi:hypothetical protein